MKSYCENTKITQFFNDDMYFLLNYVHFQYTLCLSSICPRAYKQSMSNNLNKYIQKSWRNNALIRKKPQLRYQPKIKKFISQTFTINANPGLTDWWKRNVLLLCFNNYCLMFQQMLIKWNAFLSLNGWWSNHFNDLILWWKLTDDALAYQLMPGTGMRILAIFLTFMLQKVSLFL